jgi:hypothetical protein
MSLVPCEFTKTDAFVIATSLIVTSVEPLSMMMACWQDVVGQKMLPPWSIASVVYITVMHGVVVVVI